VGGNLCPGLSDIHGHLEGLSFGFSDLFERKTDGSQSIGRSWIGMNRSVMNNELKHGDGLWMITQ
jgi:hypothetical protein